MWLASWMACVPEEPGREVQTSDAAACLQPPAEVTSPTGEQHLFEVEGVATGDAAWDGETFAWGIRCDHVSRVLTLEDADGGVWTIGYGWTEGNLDVTPAMEVQPLAPLSLVFRAVTSFGESAGFALREADRLAAVLEVGAWGPALQPSDIEGLHVGEGAVTGSAPSDCGRKVARAVRFSGDEDEVEVEATGRAPFTLDGQPMWAWALTSWGYDNQECVDAAGELSWAVWRQEGTR